MTAVTQWFCPEIDPVNVGWFQRDYGDGDNACATEHLDWWDGEQFFFGIDGEVTPVVSGLKLPWRGLADKPTKTEKGDA
nr:MAG TPA: hypothetical protein [Caudoviricetes sp.]